MPVLIPLRSQEHFHRKLGAAQFVEKTFLGPVAGYIRLRDSSEDHGRTEDQ